MKMVNRKSYNTVLDLGNVPGILLYLLDHDEAVATELKDNVLATYNRLKNTMADLVDAGLVDEEHIESPRVTYRYRLTKKGRKIATLYDEADQVLWP